MAKKKKKEQKDSNAQKAAEEMELMEENVSENGDEDTEIILENAPEELSLETELIELKASNLRLLAEFDNFRKRTQREKSELIKYGGEELMTSLLPVLDDFERAMEAIEKTDNLASLKEGVEMVEKRMQQILDRHGLESLDSKNKEFNLDQHEAISSIPVEEEKMKGKVLEVVEKGYKLRDKVIRYAKVVVGE